ncbi:replication initiator protein [Peromfec virus RodF8_9]|uniref:Replication initiator protein n=1 Tax=Peromfec virus RodF8_9 TaxID=2929390 RepID=A0A976R8U0_9VIRU|nr:replication initiator protein [Peromfec virus RodF8_9]
MCFDPHYIVHPTLNRIFKRSSFRTAYLDGETMEVTNPYSFNKRLRDPKYDFKLPKNSDYVAQHYYLFDANTGETHPLFFACPCGKCADCAASRYGELSARLQFEVLSYPVDCRVIFFTLTYRDACLPRDGVCRDDVTDFINRLHINCDRAGLPTGWRTFIVSEYGTDPRYTHRPHYHGLIFGLDLSIFGHIKLFNKMIWKSWNRGKIEWEFARSSHGVSKYCTKYVIKGLNNEFVPKGKNKNFVSMPSKSGGLGVHALKNPEILDKILNSTDGTITVKTHEYNNDGFTFGTSRIRIPRFIIDKLFPCFSRYIPANIKRCCQFAAQAWNILACRDELTDIHPPYALEKFATYLRGFVRHDVPPLVNSIVLEEYPACHYRVFRKIPTARLKKLYNSIIEYLENYRYTIEYALEQVYKRQQFMVQIVPEHKHLNPLDRVGYRSSFISKCYQDSPLDAVLQL